MLLRSSILVVVLASCSAAPVIPAEVQAAIWRAPAGGQLRIEIEGKHIRGWSEPCGIDDVPRRARFAIESILGAENPTVVLRTWHSDSMSYYAFVGDPEGVHRSVRVDPDGVVIERVHTVERAELPPAVAQRSGDARVVAFVQGDGPNRFRMWSTDRQVYVECTEDGSDYREVREVAGVVRAVRAAH
ncbi:MAG: hypothetical protein KDB80_00925 [Planctomycetes bacterium]|nr:hypothetical protein [Planctomycetota bacterium]